MRLRSLLFMGATALTTQVSAQAWVEDSVTMGPGYANDIYYSLKNGHIADAPNMNWHLAFQMTPQGPYGNVSIFANHVQGSVSVYPLHLDASTHFTTLSASDTMGKTAPSQQMFNADSSWNYGAFNRMADASDPFDYSWGKYDMASHNVVGDSLYLVNVITLAGTESYKIWVQLYDSTPADSVHWKFRMAKFDGSDDTTIKIYRKPAFEDRLFAYYNVATKSVLDREPGRYTWDILFTRYKEYLVGAPGPVPYYSVMGVLSNFDVTVAQMEPVGEDDTLGYQGFSYSKTLNQIGSDWKTFNSTTMQWTFKDSTYYFVKTKNTNEYYQLHFTGFGGAATGKAYFSKRYLGAMSTSVQSVASPVNAYFVAPNPANNGTTVMIDSKDQANGAQLMVTDMTGRMVYRTVVNVKAGLNAFSLNTSNLATGSYAVVLTNGAWKAAEKIVVQH